MCICYDFNRNCRTSAKCIGQGGGCVVEKEDILLQAGLRHKRL